MQSKLKGAALGSVMLTILFSSFYLFLHTRVWYPLAITFGTISFHLVVRLVEGKEKLQ